MPRLARLIFAFVLVLLAPLAVQADAGRYPIKTEEGDVVANFDLNPSLSTRLEKLPGEVAVANLHGDVTLWQFYDLNCPYCRAAAADVDALIRADGKLKLVLVPYAVLSVQSVRGAMVEIAAAKLLTPDQFLDFHRRIYANRGVIDGPKVLAVAKDMGLDPQKLAASANMQATLDILRDSATFGGDAGLAATPAYVIDGVAIVGHPGLTALQGVIRSVRVCGKVAC
jgi:protein-disulfide isomerase